MPKSSWLTKTVGLRSRHATILTFTVRSRMIKIWVQHTPGKNNVKSQKNRHYSMIKIYICLKIMKKTDIDLQKYNVIFLYLLH